MKIFKIFKGFRFKEATYNLQRNNHAEISSMSKKNTTLYGGNRSRNRYLDLQKICKF